MIVDGLQRAVPGRKVTPQGGVGRGRQARRASGPMFSKFFIERPIFAAVVAIVTVLLGAVAILRLPIAQYPNITPPTIYVTTSYPGASAAVVANTVGIPIEQQVNGVQGMLYMQSYSASDGTYTLIVTFDVGTDMDTAQTLVYQRVAIALAQLPPAVAAQGVTVKQQSTNMLLFANLISPTGAYDSLFLTNYAAHQPAEPAGPAARRRRRSTCWAPAPTACGSGSTRRSCRPSGWCRDDVIQALNQQNAQVAAGQTGTPPQPARPAVPVHHQRAGPARPASASSRTSSSRRRPTGGGQLVRIRDVARVELGAQTYSTFANLTGQADGRHRHLPAADRQRARRGQARQGGDGASSRSRSPRGSTT